MSEPLKAYKCRICGAQMGPGEGNICSKRCRADEYELSDADLHPDEHDRGAEDCDEEDGEE